MNDKEKIKRVLNMVDHMIEYHSNPPNLQKGFDRTEIMIDDLQVIRKMLKDEA